VLSRQDSSLIIKNEKRRVTQQTFHIIAEEVTLISFGSRPSKVTRKLRMAKALPRGPDCLSAAMKRGGTEEPPQGCAGATGLLGGLGRFAR